MDNRSVSNYTDYVMNNKQVNDSPDRLKLLKSTLKTNTTWLFGRPKMRENSTCTPLKAVHPKARFHSENKYVQGSPVNTKNNTMQMQAMKFQNEESKSPLKIKIRPKKANSTNSKVMKMLSDETPVEDEGKYLNTKDLPVLEDPEKQFKQVYKEMVSTDWQKQIESCNILRSIAVHHREILVKDWIVTRVFIQGLTKQLESLRSAVSKNALLGFKDILESLKNKMDNELDYLLPAVMKKATGTNVFLSKAAESVLVAISKNWSEIKIISAFNSLTTSKVPSTKVKMQIWIDILIKRLGNKLIAFKHNTIIMSYLTSYLTDASEKVRDKAKILLESLKQVMTPKNLEKLIRSTWNDQQEKRIFGFFESGNRTSMSVAATSRSYFNRNKSTMNRRNLASSSRYVPRQQISRMEDDSYSHYEIPELNKHKRVSSVLKTYPKKLNL
jgi:hypothetical protein